jgi:dynein heavy chain
LKKYFDDYVGPCLAFVRKNAKEVVTTVNNNLTQSLMRILDCYLATYTDSEVKKITNEEIEVLQQSLEKLFFFSIVWSIGATGDYETRQKFNTFLVGLIKKINVNWGNLYHSAQFHHAGRGKLLLKLL